MPRQSEERRSPTRAGARARRPARPSGRTRTDGPAVPIAIIKPRNAARPPERPARRSHAPATSRQRKRLVLAGQFPQHTPDGILGARADPMAARNQECFFASKVNAVAPWWPHGPRRPCRANHSQKPDSCPNAANFWITADGRSRTRTWDLFLIRKTFCPPQSSQLALNPCKPSERQVRKATGDDWPLQAGGPIVAPRPQFEGRASCDPVAVIGATIRSSPDAREADRGGACRMMSTAASFGA